MRGRVQGVGFRYEAKQVAERMGLTGFARNEQDGSVYAEVEGEEGSVKQFVVWCQQGPLGAAVERVEAGPQVELERFSRFVIQ